MDEVKLDDDSTKENIDINMLAQTLSVLIERYSTMKKSEQLSVMNLVMKLAFTRKFNRMVIPVID